MASATFPIASPSAPTPSPTGGGGWGAGSWGLAPWGTGVELPPPTLIGVSSEPGPIAPNLNPAVVAIRGGTVCKVLGMNFFARDESPFVDVEILRGGPGAYIVVGTGFVFDPDFDVARNRIFFGAPALERGLYHLRVITDGGASNVLENVIAARLFAEEFKTVSVRGKFAPKWATGPRLLRR